MVDKLVWFSRRTLEAHEAHESAIQVFSILQNVLALKMTLTMLFLYLCRLALTVVCISCIFSFVFVFLIIFCVIYVRF